MSTYIDHNNNSASIKRMHNGGYLITYHGQYFTTETVFDYDESEVLAHVVRELKAKSAK